MTDNEIIKALECCINNGDCSACVFLGSGVASKTTCEVKMIKSALDLINRQQADIDDLRSDTIPKLQAALVRANKYGIQADEANKIFKEEIKRLQGLANYHRNLINELNEGIAEIKAEAVKEFAEQVKRKVLALVWTVDVVNSADYIKCIDNLVKEWVGENNDRQRKAD